MELVQYLRIQVAKVRDAYNTSPAKRKKLYLFLKVNPNWKKPSVRAKLGGERYDWLVGLEKYGDEHGWITEATQMVVRERGHHGRRP